MNNRIAQLTDVGVVRLSVLESIKHKSLIQLRLEVVWLQRSHFSEEFGRCQKIQKVPRVVNSHVRQISEGKLRAERERSTQRSLSCGHVPR